MAGRARPRRFVNRFDVSKGYDGAVALTAGMVASTALAKLMNGHRLTGTSMRELAKLPTHAP
jgi:hypothetical protein